MIVKLVIFDMDGVILRGQEPLPHAAESVLWLRENGFKVTFLTNNSTQVPSVFADRLQNAGIETSDDDIMTSSLATAVYLDEKTEGCRNAYVVGEDGIKKALESKGFRIVNDEADVHATLRDVVRTIRYLVKLCGDHKNIGIGTDFAGYITGPKDMRRLENIGKLRNMLIDEFGEDNENMINDIMANNVIEFLKKNWLTNRSLSRMPN